MTLHTHNVHTIKSALLLLCDNYKFTFEVSLQTFKGAIPLHDLQYLGFACTSDIIFLAVPVNGHVCCKTSDLIYLWIKRNTAFF